MRYQSLLLLFFYVYLLIAYSSLNHLESRKQVRTVTAQAAWVSRLFCNHKRRFY